MTTYAAPPMALAQQGNSGGLRWTRWIVTAVILAIPFVITDEYVRRVINMVMIYSIIALSINLVVGFSGQLDMGRAAFVGIGSYWAALLTTRLHLPWALAFVTAGLVCAAAGALLGFLCRRSTFDYLTLITIGVNEIVRLVLLNWIPVTNGAMGIRLVPPPDLLGFKFNTNLRFFYFALVLLALCYVAIKRITKSKVGRAFEALRDDPIAAEYAGINVPNYKLYNFAIASFFTGIAGAALVSYTGYASPFTVTPDESIYMLQMAILGGLGSLPGSILGSAILVIAPELSRTFYQYRLMLVGGLMVVMMIWAPNGLLGKGGIGERVIGVRRMRELVRKLFPQAEGRP